LWRNARTICSDNPAIYRQQAVGNLVLNGVAPSASFLSVHAEDPATATAAAAYRGATAPGKSRQPGRADLAK
jgi:hypothetical protein